MQRKIIAATASALLSTMAIDAHAQSSVTLYGIIDAGFTYTSNQGGKTGWQAVSGNESGSRWGLLGAEDLGGGTKAIFRLENGFNVETGALGNGGAEFGRQAYVGLSNDRWGTVTLGRQYSSASDALWNDQPAGIPSLSQIALTVYDNNNLNNTYRINNSVKYVSPTVAGLTAGAQYGFSNAPGQFDANRSWSAGLDYINGALRLDAGYSLVDHPTANTTGSVATYYSASSSIISNVLRSEIYGAGGSYKIGAATAAFLYTHSRFDLIAGGSLRFANYDASLRYFVTPALLISADYTYTNQQSTTSSITNAHYNQIVGGAQYFLSKTTDLYANAGLQRASGAKAWFQGSASASSSGQQVIAVVGLRKKF